MHGHRRRRIRTIRRATRKRAASSPTAWAPPALVRHNRGRFQADSDGSWRNSRARQPSANPWKFRKRCRAKTAGRRPVVLRIGSNNRRRSGKRRRLMGDARGAPAAHPRRPTTASFVAAPPAAAPPLRHQQRGRRGPTSPRRCPSCRCGASSALRLRARENDKDGAQRRGWSPWPRASRRDVGPTPALEMQCAFDRECRRATSTRVI